jgi:hypothetical protein
MGGWVNEKPHKRGASHPQTPLEAATFGRAKASALGEVSLSRPAALCLPLGSIFRVPARFFP